MFKTLTTCGLILSAIAATTNAVAQEQEDDAGWSFELRGGFEQESAYTGSDTYLSEASLEAEAKYTTQSGTAYFFSLNELGVRFSPLENTLVLATLEFEPGRDNADDPILTGFEVVEDTIEIQLGVGRRYGPVTLGGAIQVDALGRGKGLVGFVGAQYDFNLTPRLSGQASLDLSFANAEHMNTEVGISAASSAVSGLGTYNAPGGYKGATLGLGLNYALTERLSLYSDLGVEIYGSNMSASPLIRDAGKDTTYEANIGLALRF